MISFFTYLDEKNISNGSTLKIMFPEKQDSLLDFRSFEKGGLS